MSFGQWASDYIGVPLEERFNFNPLTYFLYSGIDGAWFDPEDLSTMFQDAAGTTPVTALEQPVGLWLDKSGNGNHATQSITASRPTLSARYNLLTNSEPTAMPAVDTNPETPTSVLSVQAQYVNSNGYSITGVGFVYLGDVCGTPDVKANTPIVLSLLSSDSTPIFMYVDRIYIQSVVITVGDYYQHYITYTPESDISVTPHIRDANNHVVCRFAINIGTTPPTYQRVNTSTDYDSVGWPKYLRGDGIDDFYNLPFMNLYGNGACSIVAARDAVSQATDTYVISERSTTDADPKYFPSRQLASGGNMDSYIVTDEGTVRLDTTGSAFSGAKLAAIRSVVDSGSNIKLFKDGAVVADDNYTRAGTLTLNNTTLGASVSTTTSNYANMRLYGLIITKSALSDTDRRRCEQFLASRLSTLGVTLS